MKRHANIVAAVLLGVGGVIGIAQTSPSAAPMPAQTTSVSDSAEDAHWQHWLTRLDNADGGTRQAAQQELDKTTWQDLPALKRIIGVVTDPEVKSRLSARIVAIEEDIAVNPPPISINLNSAGVDEWQAALGKILGPRVVYSRFSSAPPITFQAKEQPFGEFIVQLAAAYPLTFKEQGYNAQLVIARAGWRNGVAFGHAAIFPQSITRKRVVSFQSVTAPQFDTERYFLNCITVIDPRIIIIPNYSDIRFTEIHDDAGNSLRQVPMSEPHAASTNNSLIDETIALDIPEKRGQRIASAKGTISMTAQVAEARLEIPDLENKSGQSFVIDGHTVNLVGFHYVPERSRVSYNFMQDTSIWSSSLNITILDAEGKTVRISHGGSGGWGGIQQGDFTPPFKMILAVPTKRKAITIPFELKDLPLP